MTEPEEIQPLVLLGDADAATCVDETCMLPAGVGHSAPADAESDASDNG